MADGADAVEDQGMVRTAKDLFSGACGGIAQVLIGTFRISVHASCLRCTTSLVLLRGAIAETVADRHAVIQDSRSTLSRSGSRRRRSIPARWTAPRRY